MNGGQLISNGRAYSVTIQHLAGSTADEDGFETEEWEDYYTNYASVNNLYGNERWMAAQVQMDQAVRFTFRWHSKLDAVKAKYYRLVWNGKVFAITYVDNIRHENETVRVDALEVEA